MTEEQGPQQKVPLAGEQYGSSESIEVVNPYDGSVVGRVPRCSGDDVDRAVRAAAGVLHREPLPPWRRAEILDHAASLLADRRDDFARTIAVEAAKPIKTARVEAERAVSTFQFAAAVARTLTGEMVPIDASSVGEGKLGFVLSVPVGVVGAGGVEAGEPDAVLGHRARQPPTGRVRLASQLVERRHRQRG
jgi:acyl-CoA reductase-like NAD-dependent aldehyde dehydrogenase